MYYQRYDKAPKLRGYLDLAIEEDYLYNYLRFKGVN